MPQVSVEPSTEEPEATAAAPSCESVPLVMPGGALITGTFELGPGDITCSDARDVVAEYLVEVSTGASGGNAGYVELRGGHCIFAGAVKSQETGQVLTCRSDGWDMGGAAEFSVVDDGDRIEGPIDAVLASLDDVEIAVCPAAGEYCLEVIEQTEDRAVVVLSFGLEYDTLFLLEPAESGWRLVEQVEVSGSEAPSWAADLLS